MYLVLLRCSTFSLFCCAECEHVGSTDENDARGGEGDDEEEELDREMGDGEDPNEQVVDEKMWDNDEDGKYGNCMFLCTINHLHKHLTLL